MSSRKPQDQTIPPKLFKMSSNLIGSHLCNVINYNIEDKSFPDSAKIGSPHPIYKKKSRHKIEKLQAYFNIQYD